MSIEIFEVVPGGDPASRRPAWSGETDLPSIPRAPHDVEKRREQRVATGIAGIRARALADSLVPEVPADIQHARQQGHLVTDTRGDELVYEPENAHREYYVPLGGLGEDVMLLEALGENIVIHDHSRRKVQVGELIDKRRQAICKAGVERDKAMDRVFRYDRAITQYNANLQSAMNRGDVKDAQRWAGRIAKLNALRAIVGGNAVRYAKVQALGQAMLKSALTEQNLLTLAEMASKRGLPNEANTLKQAADVAAKNDKRYGQMRKIQIANWTVQSADAKLNALRLLVTQTQAQINQLQSQKVSAALEGEKARQLEHLRTKLATAQKKLEETKQQLVSSGIRDTQINITPVEKQAQLAAAFVALESDLGNLGSLWGSISGAVSDAASAVKGAVVDVAKAGVELAKKGACALANNPKVLSAAGAAIGTAVSGGTAGAAGAQAGRLAPLLSSACPASKPAAAPAAFMPKAAAFKPVNTATFTKNISAPVTAQPPTSKVVPIAIGAGAAGLIALIALA